MTVATMPTLQLQLRGGAVITVMAESMEDSHNLGDTIELNLEGSCTIHVPRHELVGFLMTGTP